MALGPRRVNEVTESQFAHERAGLEKLRQLLPDVDPYHLWTNALLVDGGRSYEIDALVIGKHAIYLIELKAWSGEIRGDIHDWFISQGGRERQEPNPLRLVEHKAKVLKSKLKAKLGDRIPIRVEALVFLHCDDVKLRLGTDAGARIVTGEGIARAITLAKYPGAPANPGWWLGDYHEERIRGKQWQRAAYTLDEGEIVWAIDRPLMEHYLRGVKALGLRASEKNNRLGDYRIVDQLEDGDLYQDFLASKPDLGGRDVLYRVRVFPSGLEEDAGRREQLDRAAVREERVLRDVSGHPNVVSAQPGFPTARGPAIPMEHLPDGVSLFTWIETRPNADLDARLRVIQQVVEAIAHCHARKVVHRNLSPAAVIVTGGDTPQVHLRNFGFAHRLGTHATLTGSLGAVEREKLYRAPEAFVSHERSTEAADIFSLGAVAFFVLTGRDPARDLKERNDLLESGHGLRLTTVDDGFIGRAGPADELGTAREMDEVVATATHPEARSRWLTATDFLKELLTAATGGSPTSAPEAPDEPPSIDPLHARPGDVLGPDLVVDKLLGSGATSIVYLVRTAEAPRVLKVARDARASDFLLGEARTIGRLKHQRIVKLERPPFTVGGHDVLLLDMAGETTLAQYLRDEGAATLDFAARWGRELLETVQYLEERGVFHRDLKPSNIGLEIVGKKEQKSILLFDFSHSHLPLESIDAGTEAYRDPHLVRRGKWDHHAEHYSAALVLYELLTGTLPRRPNSPTQAAEVAPESLVESCREGLTAFFDRALHPDVASRFSTAQELLQAWVEAANVRARASRPTKPIEQTTADTPVWELELSDPARNALDRNRVNTAGELARTPRNRLLMFKGVGRKVAHELLALAEHLRARFKIDEATPLPDPIVPDFPLEPRSLLDDPGPLPPEMVLALAEDGITTDLELACRSAADLEPLLSGELLERAKEWMEDRRARVGASPGTLSGWVEEAKRGLPRAKKDRALLERLLGLQRFGDLGPTAAPTQVELAKAEGCAQAHISRRLLSARGDWIQSRLGRLTLRLTRLLHRLGGALTLDLLARRLFEDLSPRTAPPPAPTLEGLRQAAFLIRVVCETASDTDPPLLRRRLRGGREVVEAVEDQWSLVAKLVERVERLGSERPLPSVQRVLAIVEDEVERQGLVSRLEATPPPELSLPDDPVPDRSTTAWLRLATELSATVALSRRGEVYPRDLEPSRQLELLQPSLQPVFSPEDLRGLATERFPDATNPLPDGESLRELLAQRGYVWDDGLAVFRRRGETFATQYTRSVPTTPRGAPVTGLTTSQLSVDLVTERLMTAAREHSFRVLMVAPQRIDGAVDRLLRVLERATERSSLCAHSVDLGLAQQLRHLLDADFPGQDLWSVAVGADAAGPDVSGPERESWDELVRFAGRAADAFLDDLLARMPPGDPLVLRDLGLVARFGLTGFLERLARVAEADERIGSVFVVVVQTEAAHPRINDALEVPATPGQSLRLNRDWVLAGVAADGPAGAMA